MVCLKIRFLVLACFVFIDAQVIPVRYPKKCGKVRKLVNNVPECACGKLEPIYSIIGEVPKCGCGKVYLEPTKDICGCKVPSVDSGIVGLLDYITGVVEKKCGCQVTPCGCQKISKGQRSKILR
ncbi:hypothetical protein K1T71_014248 [Dendrolimus kikuchii]|uniref:Uncharacterized protein n=1 Tax=Dendrolimus kikuchii TaxID=765133 RepID=A0ACC1CFP0_9NEOP|nr:hypothetical protein K1T71_014248 [Dendrolimus kikuchii]